MPQKSRVVLCEWRDSWLRHNGRPGSLLSECHILPAARLQLWLHSRCWAAEKRKGRPGMKMTRPCSLWHLPTWKGGLRWSKRHAPMLSTCFQWRPCAQSVGTCRRLLSACIACMQFDLFSKTRVKTCAEIGLFFHCQSCTRNQRKIISLVNSWYAIEDFMNSCSFCILGCNQLLIC